MEDYVMDVVVIWQLKDDVTIDDVDTLHVKRMDCSESHKYRYRTYIRVYLVHMTPCCT
jgi:hypothetical protein